MRSRRDLASRSPTVRKLSTASMSTPVIPVSSDAALGPSTRRLTPGSSQVNHRSLRRLPVANIASAEKQNRKMIKHRARNRAAMAIAAHRREEGAHRRRQKAAEAPELVKDAVVDHRQRRHQGHPQAAAPLRATSRASSVRGRVMSLLPVRRAIARLSLERVARHPASSHASVVVFVAALRGDAVLAQQLVEVLAIHVGVARGLRDVAVGALDAASQVAALEQLVPLLLGVAERQPGSNSIAVAQLRALRGARVGRRAARPACRDRRRARARARSRCAARARCPASRAPSARARVAVGRASAPPLGRELARGT